MKGLTVVFSIIFLFASANLVYSQAEKQTKATGVKRSKSIPTANRKSRSLPAKESNFSCDLPASVTALELSHNEIILSCPAADKDCSNNRIIKVRAVAIDTSQEKYVYSVSAGKILGEGANVEWDLSDVESGSYTITAGVSQPIFNGTKWAVLGTPKTKIVVIKE